LAGTTIGSIQMYDLTDHTNESTRVPPIETEDGQKYWFTEPTFTTDGFETQTHFNPIVKILSLFKKGSSRIVSMDESGTIS